MAFGRSAFSDYFTNFDIGRRIFKKKISPPVLVVGP